jgi:16S rRNA (uracil1498-N3)-methyltransferase
MRRYWLPADCKAVGPSGDEIFLVQGDELHHIRDVCRQDVGDRFEVLCGDGRAALVEVEASHKRQMITRVLSWREIPALPEPRLALALCFCRPAIFDSVVEKAVELGVERLQPLTSERSFWSSEKGAAEKKLERAARIVRSATQQCGRGELMSVETIRSLVDWVKEMNLRPRERCLFLYEGAEAQPLRQAVERIRTAASDGGRPERVWVLIGSEGGFSPSEHAELIAAGLTPATLGPQVLRVETACVTTLGVLKYELGQME